MANRELEDESAKDEEFKTASSVLDALDEAGESQTYIPTFRQSISSINFDEVCSRHVVIAII